MLTANMNCTFKPNKVAMDIKNHAIRNHLDILEIYVKFLPHNLARVGFAASQIFVITLSQNPTQ